jgi:hypothetical protein
MGFGWDVKTNMAPPPEGCTEMSLTSRQLAFLRYASRIEGYCPWDPPAYAPVLKNEEMRPIIDGKLAEFYNGEDAWFITAAGEAELTKIRVAEKREGSK